MTVFWKAFAWTAIPIVTLSIMSTVGAAYGVSGVKFWAGFYFVWYVAVAVWLAASLAMVVFYATGKRESASGVLVGVGVGVLAVGTTGLVNLPRSWPRFNRAVFFECSNPVQWLCIRRRAGLRLPAALNHMGRHG